MSYIYLYLYIVFYCHVQLINQPLLTLSTSLCKTYVKWSYINKDYFTLQKDP